MTHCRKALHRAVQCTSDYPEHVCEVLLSFERVEGEFHPGIKKNREIKNLLHGRGDIFFYLLD